MNSRCLRILSVILALNLLSACPDDPADVPPAADAGTLPTDGGSTSDAGSLPDAGGQDAGTAVDAGTPITSCDQVAEGCVSNETCADGETCKSFGTDPDRCCAPGQRGAIAEGAACTNHEECAYGYCADQTGSTARFCSGPCETDTDCTALTMECINSLFGKHCMPRDAGAEPESCAQLSLDQCFSNDACEANERCEDFDSTEETEVFCCTVGARGTKGVGEDCANELDCSYGRCIGGLCTADCDLDVDPCPPETMECNLIRELCEPLP